MTRTATRSVETSSTRGPLPTRASSLSWDLGTPSDTVTVQFMAAGKATLFAWTPNVQGMTILTVTGESSEDGGAP